MGAALPFCQMAEREKCPYFFFPSLSPAGDTAQPIETGGGGGSWLGLPKGGGGEAKRATTSKHTHTSFLGGGEELCCFSGAARRRRLRFRYLSPATHFQPLPLLPPPIENGPFSNSPFSPSENETEVSSRENATGASVFCCLWWRERLCLLGLAIKR